MASAALWLNFSRLPRVLGGPLKCSFCGRREDEVTRLVAGAAAHICDACIGKCVSVLEAHGGFVPLARP
jgi:ATP-dependent Clp protease ATP-binding subunit ClpX